MNRNDDIASDFLLQQISSLAEEVFFAFKLEEHQFLYLSPIFDELWNLSCESVKNNLGLLSDSVHKDDISFVTQSFSDVQDNQKRQSIEFRIHPLHQQEKWIKLVARFVEQDKHHLIIGMAKDCTVEKKYNAILYEYFDKKNSLLDILSHDLTTPLKNIYSSSRVLREYIENGKDEAIVQLLEIIEETSRNGINLIHSFVNKEFMDMSKTVLLKSRVDIVKRLSEVIGIYRTAKPVVKTNYHLETSAESIYAEVDVIKFMQAIQNLITNAQKFTKENGNITILVEEINDTVSIKVKDDGIGIPAELEPYLFEKFSKAKRVGIRGEPTTGLGLYIIKNIVEWHKGHVWYEPSEQGGSTFGIAIPKESVS